MPSGGIAPSAQLAHDLLPQLGGGVDMRQIEAIEGHPDGGRRRDCARVVTAATVAIERLPNVLTAEEPGCDTGAPVLGFADEDGGA